MVFSDPLFLFGFLPFVLTLHTIAPKTWRNGILLAASLAFYCWGEAQFVAVMIGSIGLNYFLGIKIGSCDSPTVKKRWLELAICANLAILILFKYTNFILENIGGFTGLETDLWTKIHLPIGISFFTFQAMSYVIDVYRSQVEAQRNIYSLALYIASFPQLIAGPIVRYCDVSRQLVRRVLTFEKFSYGVQRFIIGLGKKVIIANVAAEIADKVFAMQAVELSTCDAWLGAFAYSLQIYFDFSGYSDMAIGLGYMFGFRFVENFNYPYISRSITEFWRRWHISLSTWFRDYLYIPLGGNRFGRARTYGNLMIVFVLCGLWHRASWTFLLWGLYHGLFLILERQGLSKILKYDKPSAHVYTLLVVLGGWVLFRCETLSQTAGFYGAMFGLANQFELSTEIRMMMQQYHVGVIAFAIVAATPLGSIIVRRFEEFGSSPTKWQSTWQSIFYLSMASVLGLQLVWASCLVVSGTYNPFIYFRF